MSGRRIALLVAAATVLVVGATPLTAAGLDESGLDEPTASETPVEEPSGELPGTTDGTTDGVSEPGAGTALDGDGDGGDGTLEESTDDPLADPTDEPVDGGDLDGATNDVTDDATATIGDGLDEATDPDPERLLGSLVALVEDTTGTGGDGPDGDGDGVQGSDDTGTEPAENPQSQDDPGASGAPQEETGPASQGDSMPRGSLDAAPAGPAGRTPVRPADPASPEDAEPAAPPLPHRVEVIARNEEAGLAYPELRLPEPLGFGQRSPDAPWAWPFDAGAYTRHPGQRTTVALVDELLHLGVEPHVIGNVLAPFPVAGPAVYSDDWGAPRWVPTYHAHQGTDIFAERGTPVVASFDGVISRRYDDSAIGGNGLKLAMADGTYAYYAHLDGFAPGVVAGARVAKGTVLGYVGDTGNALGTPPHLHYELHPGGGVAVPPVPYLDAWLEEARAEVLLIRGPGIDASILRPAPAPVAPPISPASPGAAGAASSSAGSSPALPASPAGIHSRGLVLLSVWVVAISAGYVLLRRRGLGGAPVPATAAATARAAPARDVLAPLLPSRERGPVRIAA